MEEKVEPKWCQRASKKRLKMMSFLIEKGIEIGAKMETKGSLEEPQNRQNSSIFRGPSPGPSKGGQLEQKGRQNEVKMELKWSQNGAKME